MQIVDAPATLGFSFWQPVALLGLYIFRHELKDLVQKVTSLKVAGSEITWNQKSDTVAWTRYAGRVSPSSNWSRIGVTRMAFKPSSCKPSLQSWQHSSQRPMRCDGARHLR